MKGQLKAHILIYHHEMNRKHQELHESFETSKLVSQGYTLSNKAIPPYPFQTLLQTGDQLFNYISLWGAFYSNITDTIQTLSNPATYLRNIKLVLIFVDVLFLIAKENIKSRWVYEDMKGWERENNKIKCNKKKS